MSDNSLGPEGAVALAPALMQLTQLTGLRLGGECYVRVWVVCPFVPKLGLVIGPGLALVSGVRVKGSVGMDWCSGWSSLGFMLG